MPNEIELQQAIYNLLETQIEFGVHRYGDSLPTIKTASTYFMASVDTVRLAYVRLKKEGLITLSTCVGAAVKVQYSDEEIQRHILDYFSCRREPLLSFAESVGLLANYTLWFSLKSASDETLDALERSCFQMDIPQVYRMSQQFQLLYRPLGNDLLLRFHWQLFLFFQAPFVSSRHNTDAANKGPSPLLSMIQLARGKDFAALWTAVETTIAQHFSALRRFFEENIPQTSDCEQIDFTWSIYKKASQICYSLCIDILTGIHQGSYPVNRLLPSPQKLAQDRQVSLNTVRRAIGLLNKLGATNSINGIGTKVLPPLESTQNCDFTDTTIQKRLLGFLHCLHLLTFSCRACAQITIETMSADSICQWVQSLESIKQTDEYECMVYICYEFISLYAPFSVIRTAYAELTRQLFWGFSLRNLHGSREDTKAHFLPYLVSLIDRLSCADASGFSAILEELQTVETGYTAQWLLRLGIEEAGFIVLPNREY